MEELNFECHFEKELGGFGSTSLTLNVNWRKNFIGFGWRSLTLNVTFEGGGKEELNGEA